jgi:Cof subfamily protein (haloacid dehalogenase superfamily)
MYKLIALDMDGTLLSKDKTISKANFKAIQRAKAKGVKVVLATGRPINGIKRYLNELNLIEAGDYAVAYNGALIQQTDDDKVIADNPMSLEDLKYLHELSKKLKVHIHFLTESKCVTTEINEYSQLESTMNGIPLEIADFDNLPIDTNVVKIMFIDTEEYLSKVIEQLPEEVYEKYTVVRSSPYFLEFLNKKVSKGFGVGLLAESLGISHKEVICVGDAGNDIDMIKYAGLGVAMGNAFPEVKEIADYITCTNEEDGVAEVINKFILEEEKVS